MQAPSEEKDRTPIIAIGASAGGLEALQEFFSQMPAGSGFAFVVIQHLAPQHDSMLAQLLGRSAKMPVAVAVDGARAEADHVYVIAPGTMLGIANGNFRVRPAEGERHARIDAFFKALADDLGTSSVGIILSGFGADGTSGLRAIQEAGGLTLAQAPETALHDAMPRSAIDTGVVQHILPIRDMPAKLLERAKVIVEGRIATPEVAAPAVSQAAMKPSDQELVPHLQAIYESLQRATGHDFSRYKRGMVLRRLRRRLTLRQASSPEVYVTLLSKDPGEAKLLARDLFIGVTQFFREPEAFEYLKFHVLPQIFVAKRQDEGVRIWVPGCASGEEAYSIGILVREQLDAAKSTRPVQIFATDIDAEAVDVARAALYPADIANAVSPARIERFFTRDSSSYRVTREVREMCIFSQHSMIRDPPFLAIDLISCRNVLIYLDTELQKRLVPVFHYALRPGGFLFLGSSEGLAGHPELFEMIEKRFRVFQRLEPATRPHVEFPLPSRPTPRAAQPRTGAPPSAPTDAQALSTAFERLLLQKYVPPSAVVTAQGGVLCVAGPTGRYLQPPAGALTTNILDIADASLRIGLRTALHASAHSGRKVVKDNVVAEVDDALRRIRITVRPLHRVKTDDLFAVVLQEQALAAEAGEAGESLPAVGRDSRIEQLESELCTTRDQLRLMIEELEDANQEVESSREEMLATNEEMQSSNEEMQSAQEELRSLNEELATVNTELAHKLEELARANSDLQNLFGSTDIATVFLDCELRLTRFTPAAKALFRLIEADIGRPLAPRFANVDLSADVAGVLHTLRPVERQVETIDRQACYLLRVLPYYTVENAIAGAVVTLTDITQIRRAELELGEANRRLGEANQRKSDFLAVLSHELRNPLAPIRSSLDVLDRISPAHRTDDERRAYEVIRRQFDYLTRLADDLLDVTRITSGQISLQREVLDLNELTRHTVEDHRDAFVRGGIELTFVAAPAAVRVNGDPARLAQAVGNLLHNAAKFTPRGGMTIVSIGSDATRTQAFVRVMDTGQGIASETLPRLFEPFTQLDTALDRQKGGLGLGLAVTKSLVELHGGSIVAASDGPGKGRASPSRCLRRPARQFRRDPAMGITISEASRVQRS